jgi:hypothetical protein
MQLAVAFGVELGVTIAGCVRSERTQSVDPVAARQHQNHHRLGHAVDSARAFFPAGFATHVPRH